MKKAKPTTQSDHGDGGQNTPAYTVASGGNPDAPSILETFVEHAPASLVMFDNEMRYLAVSKRWLVECGIAGQNVIGRCHYEVFPNIPDRWKDAHRRGLSGETVKAEESWKAADGTLRIASWEIQPWMTAAGTVGGIIIFSDDITDRKLAEAELSASEERWRTTLGSIGDAVLTCDANGRITYLNDAAEKLTGWTLPEAMGLPVQQVFHIVEESTGHLAEDIVGAVLREAQTVELVNHTAIITRDGRAVPIEDSASPIIDAAGKVAGVALVFHDVTSRRRTINALRSSEQQYRALVDNMNEGLATMRIIYDDAGRPVDFEYLNANPEFLRMLGGQDVIGKRASEAQPSLLEEHPELLQIHHLTATTGVTNRFEEWSAKLSRWFSISSYSPQEGQFVVLVSDITARKEAEAEQQRSAELLRKTGELSQVGGWELDPATGAVQWTDEIVRIHDLAPAVAIDLQRGLSYYHPDSRPIIERAVKEAIELGCPYDLELQLISAKGVHKWVRTIGEAVMKNGKVVRIVGSLQDITERKHLEMDLQRNKERAELAVRVAELGEWEFSPQTGLAIQSLRHAQILGYDKPQKDWSLDRFLSHVLPELREDVRRQLQDDTSPDGFEYQTQIRRLDGEVRWIWVRGRIWLDEHNLPVRIFGTTMDITERRKMAAELEQSQRVLRSVFNNASIGLYRTTPDGSFLMANPAMCRMMGYENESELYKHNVESEGFGITYDRAAFRRDLEAAGELNGYEAVWYRRDGSRIFVRESAKAFRNANGEIEYYEGTVEDISDRRYAEEALAQSEARLRSYLDNAPFAIHVLDSSGIIVDCNPLAHLMLGYTKEELLGMSVMQLHPKEELQSARNAFAQLQLQGRVEIDIRYHKKDGQEIWVALSAVQMANGFSISFLNDITEIRASQAHVRELEEQFRQAQKMEAIGRLAGGIAHDFNNLLMIIMAHAEQLTMDGTSVGSRAESISKAAGRAAELTGQLLAFSRKQTIQPITSTLGKVVDGVAEMLTRLVGEDVVIDIRHGRDEWPVRLDRSQFEQAIMNLAVNARDAMPNGGHLVIETLNCTFDAASTENPLHLSPGEYVLLRVSDTGTGMSEEVKSRVFEPFFTTKSEGKGTGLGLSMVYGIVKQSSGEIWIDSKLGSGTDVSIYLPRVQEASPCAVVQPAPHPPLSKNHNRQILMVEDEDYLRDVIAELLSAAGYQVLQASNEEEAIALSAQHKESIDLLLTDVVLKGGNGRELVRSLNAAGCNFKVLYMSGYTPDSIVQHGVLEAGANFIQKPFSKAAIVKKIEEILES